MDEIENAGVVLGTSVNIRTMADGTLRISFDVEPRHAQQAFALFGSPGTPAAVARIMPEVAQQQARQQAIASDRPKGGELCKLAARFCESEEFCDWLRLKYHPRPTSSADAAEIIKGVCGITSRAYLDHDERAAAIFHETFRLPYAEYRSAR